MYAVSEPRALARAAVRKLLSELRDGLESFETMNPRADAGTGGMEKRLLNIGCNG